MGRFRKKGKQPRNRQAQEGNWKPYELLAKESKEFETYYQNQKIVPDGEWDLFIEYLKKPLPTTFRITGFKRQAQELLGLIKSEYFDNLVSIEIEGKTIEPPKCLPWYPDELAWQLDLDRKRIRQSEPLKKLHKFLIEETESGNLSRQEAVSMIPPLVLDVQPHHKVFDMCAAPGSKTSQLIEMLHRGDNPVPEGCVVANDSDNKRCYLMTHQVKRLESPSFIIVNQDASCMPNFKVPDENGDMKSLKFDRILADVPCSGDGTLRKNVDAWGKWHVHTAMHLHNMQSRILSRGLEMLAVGGRLVYSTCSFNPIENEAVISNLLRKSQDAVHLVDVSDTLPGIKFTHGVSSWTVMSRELEIFASIDDVPTRLQSTIRPSVFPPSEEEVTKFGLDKCMRILPHHQDTGGFFIAVIEKTGELPWVKHVWKPRPEADAVTVDETTPAPATDSNSKVEGLAMPKETVSSASHEEEAAVGSTGADGESQERNPKGRKRYEDRPGSPTPKRQKKNVQYGYKEDPFIFLDETDPVWPPIQKFFELKNFPAEQLLVRCSSGKKRNIYFASAIVKKLVTNNMTRLKFINLGLKILSRSDSPHVSCSFRTVQDGIAILFPYVTTRMVELTKEDIVTLLSTEMPFINKFDQRTQDQLLMFSQGSIIFVFDPDKDARPDSPKCRIVLCGWLGRTSCRSFIPLGDRGHYLRMCGEELKTKDQKLEEKTNAEDNSTEKEAEEPQDVADEEEYEGNSVDETLEEEATPTENLAIVKTFS